MYPIRQQSSYHQIPASALLLPKEKEVPPHTIRGIPSLRSLSKNDLRSHALALHKFRHRPLHEAPCEFFLWECLKRNALATAEALLDCDLVEKKRLIFKAIQVGCSHQIRWLILQGCNPNEVDEDEKTALHRAAAQKALSALETLSSLHSVNINQPDKEGNTPLHIGYQHMDGIDLNREAIVSCLLKNGANPQRKNDRGYLPKEMISATHSKNREIEFILGHVNSIPDDEPHIFEGSTFHTMCRSLAKALESTLIDKQEERDLFASLALAFRKTSRCSSEANPLFITPSLEKDIQKGSLVILPLIIRDECPIGHVFYLVFTQGYYAICNRGDKLPPTKKTTEIFSIDSSRFKQQDLLPFWDASSPPSHQMNYLYYTLPKLLSGKKLDLEPEVHDTLSLPLQKVGNCTYANAKAALRVSLFFHFLKTLESEQAAKQATSFSKRISTHCRLFYLDQYCKERVDRDWYLFNTAWRKTKKRNLKSFDPKNYPKLIRAVGATAFSHLGVKNTH